jgi:NADH-quinone oxidoreductase subunit E
VLNLPLQESYLDVAGEKELEAFIATYLQREGRGSLVGALLAIQQRFGYLPAAGMELLAERFGLRPVNVYAVATFYNRFRFRPPARHCVKVCTGTACHIKQAGKILDHWKRKLEIDEGGMTADGRYQLERVACVGCCTLAPVTVLDDQIIGHMSTSKADGLLLQHQQQDNATDGGKP